jgi:hypothetical protein
MDEQNYDTQDRLTEEKLKPKKFLYTDIQITTSFLALPGLSKEDFVSFYIL